MTRWCIWEFGLVDSYSACPRTGTVAVENRKYVMLTMKLAEITGHTFALTSSAILRTDHYDYLVVTAARLEILRLTILQLDIRT